MLIGLLAAVAIHVGNRSEQTIPDLVRSLNWQPATSGPMIAVCKPWTTKATDLAAAGLKIVKVGAVSAIVPKTMFIVHDDFKEHPNFYDGLPRSAKVVYLMRSLKPDQWRKMSGAGLALSDCQGEQVAVFRSILPKNPVVAEFEVISPGESFRDMDRKQSIPQNQISDIRLRIQKQIELTAPIANNGGSAFVPFAEGVHKGDKVLWLDETRNGLFGYEVLEELPNRLKKSDLDYSSVGPARPTGSRSRALWGLRDGNVPGGLRARSYAIPKGLPYNGIQGLHRRGLCA